VKLRIGVAMPLKGGRPAIVATEIKETRDPRGRLLHHFDVGAIERITPYSVEATKARILQMVGNVREHLPCVMIDIGSPQGLALHQSMRAGYDPSLHRPHLYQGTGILRPELFSTFLQGYAAGRISFQPDLPGRSALDRALVFYMGGGVEKSGVELSSEDEALVVALGLAMIWPKHGPKAAPFILPESGTMLPDVGHSA
jgi:hypothetical protein